MWKQRKVRANMAQMHSDLFLQKVSGDHPKRAEEIIQELPANVLKIGVFVNESVEVIQKIADECGLTHVQLHGDEDNYQIRRLNIPSIKSLGVTSESDMKTPKGMKRIIYYLIARKKSFMEEMERHFHGNYLEICQKNCERK